MIATGAADRVQRTLGESQSAAYPRVSEFYACFNERRFDDAAAMFAADAVVEQAPAPQPRRGGTGYLEFARMWTQGFPDATVAIERVFARTSALYEIELTAHGTRGTLELGGGGQFRPTGVRASLSLRQLLQLDDQELVTYSSLSFDIQDIVAQLGTVDEARLVDQTRKFRPGTSSTLGMDVLPSV
jgi:predicted ester cyclase